jgi:hypothetical protein
MAAKESKKVGRMELVTKISEIIEHSTHDPADELIAMGEALAKVGYALKGQTMHDARAILTAVRAIA